MIVMSNESKEEEAATVRESFSQCRERTVLVTSTFLLLNRTVKVRAPIGGSVECQSLMGSMSRSLCWNLVEFIFKILSIVKGQRFSFLSSSSSSSSSCLSES